MKFKFFKHTADIKFQAYGKTMEQALSNAAIALFEIMCNTEEVQPKITENITAEGTDKKALLLNFLEELVFLLDTKHFLLHQVKNITIKENTIKATVIGDTAENYITHSEVKAITYNDMMIKEELGKITLQVVVDV